MKSNIRKNEIDKLFEEKNERKIKLEEWKPFLRMLDIDVCEEYKYILENYAESFLKENYVIKPIEIPGIADEDGYISISYFYGVAGKNSVPYQYDIYKNQIPNRFLPIGAIASGNLLCISREDKKIYIWIHDAIDRDCYLIRKNFPEFIYGFEEKKVDNIDTGNLKIVKENFSDNFLNALKNFKSI